MKIWKSETAKKKKKRKDLRGKAKNDLFIRAVKSDDGLS